MLVDCLSEIIDDEDFEVEHHEGSLLAMMLE
jgi:hypothetical protein